MNKNDLKKIIGAAKDQVDYAPVAMLLRNGYACFGHFNSHVNEDMDETLVVLNASVMELKQTTDRNRPAVEDFREFLLEIVAAYESNESADIPTREDLGKTIPLVAIPLDEIAIVYPVSHIVELLTRADDHKDRAKPALFDFNRSEILTVLNMKLW